MTYLFKKLCPLASEENMYAHAQENFEHAQRIAQGGIAEARIFARAWFEAYQPSFWRHATNFSHGSDKVAKRLVNEFADDALECAKRITERGSAYYVATNSYGHKMLMTATLCADATAGPTGYIPMKDAEQTA